MTSESANARAPPWTRRATNQRGVINVVVLDQVNSRTAAAGAGSEAAGGTVNTGHRTLGQTSMTRELAALGEAASIVPGGAEWTGGPGSLYRSSLALRTASRVLVRVGAFRARTFHELERRSPKLACPDIRCSRGTAFSRPPARRRTLLRH